MSELQKPLPGLLHQNHEGFKHNGAGLRRAKLWHFVQDIWGIG